MVQVVPQGQVDLQDLAVVQVHQDRVGLLVHQVQVVLQVLVVLQV